MADSDLASIITHARNGDPATFAAQARRAEINGMDRTYFCGAYWRFGFHEDGVVSAADVIADLQRRLSQGAP